MYMIAGQSGSMKTKLALNFAYKSKVPTMYFSNDSDDMTMTNRALSISTGIAETETELWIDGKVEYAQNILRQWSHVKWAFNSGPSLDYIDREMDAFAEIHGAYPEHTIIDILMGVDYEGVAESQNYWGLMAELHSMSRKWQTALGLVHHTTEAVKGDPCQPKSAIMGKASHLPTVIYTVAPDEFGNYLNLAVVKNRFGQSDLTGRTAVQLPIKPWCSQVELNTEADAVERPDGTGLRSGGMESGADHDARGEAEQGIRHGTSEVSGYGQSLADF